MVSVPADGRFPDLWIFTKGSLPGSMPVAPHSSQHSGSPLRSSITVTRSYSICSCFPFTLRHHSSDRRHRLSYVQLNVSTQIQYSTAARRMQEVAPENSILPDFVPNERIFWMFCIDMLCRLRQGRHLTFFGLWIIIYLEVLDTHHLMKRRHAYA